MLEAKQYIDKWNEVFGTSYRSTRSIRQNLLYWLEDYSISDIQQAIEGIKNHSYWKDKSLSPVWLLRTKNKHGELVDYIGEMLNFKSTEKVVVIR